MKVVLLSNDLMVVSRVQGAAAGGGLSVTTVSDAAQAIECCRAMESGTLLVDLAVPAVDMNVLVSDLKILGTQSPRIVAFGPHVHEQRLAAARQAGCDEVVSRGQFFAQLESLLRG
jgi:CheY-like chemotaxis protein